MGPAQESNMPFCEESCLFLPASTTCVLTGHPGMDIPGIVSQGPAVNAWKTSLEEFMDKVRIWQDKTVPNTRKMNLFDAYINLKSAYEARSRAFRNGFDQFERDSFPVRDVVSRFNNETGDQYKDPATGQVTLRRIAENGRVQVQGRLASGHKPTWTDLDLATNDLQEAQRASWYAFSGPYEGWLALSNDLRIAMQSAGPSLQPWQRAALQNMLHADVQTRRQLLSRWKPVWANTCGPGSERWTTLVYADSSTIEEAPHISLSSGASIGVPIDEYLAKGRTNRRFPEGDIRAGSNATSWRARRQGALPSVDE